MTTQRKNAAACHLPRRTALLALLSTVMVLSACGQTDRVSGTTNATTGCTRHATDFTLPDLAGRPHRLQQYLDEMPVMLFFFTSWCPYCRAEVPRLKAIEQAQGTLGVKLVAIGAGLDDNLENVRDYALEHRLPYVILYDEGTAVSSRYGVKTVPAAFLVRQDRCIVPLGNRVSVEGVQRMR